MMLCNAVLMVLLLNFYSSFNSNFFFIEFQVVGESKLLTIEGPPYHEDRILKERNGCWYCILPYKGFLEIWTALLRIQSVVPCPAHYVLLKAGISFELQDINLDGVTVSNNLRRKLTETRALNIRMTSSGLLGLKASETIAHCLMVRLCHIQ